MENKNIIMYKHDDCTVIKIITGQKWNENCYIVINDISKIAFVIDPGYDCEIVNDLIEDGGYIINYIFATHAHHDHIAGVHDLSEKLALPCIIHPDDKKILMHSPMYSIRFAQRNMQRPQNISWLDNILIDKLKLDGINILHTPGHTNGGICIFYKDMMFTGDTVVKNYLGRTDLPEGNKKDIIESLEKLLMYAKCLNIKKIYPGHGKVWDLDSAQKWWESQNINEVKKLNMF